jgi:hypothetical protein
VVDESGDYRPVSWLAVAAAIGGIVSAIALLGPLFWVVPLLATLLALVALADVGRDGATKVGRWAALAGLFLAIGFASQAISGHVVGRWVAGRRAEATARHWVATVQQGNVTDAAKMLDAGAIDRGPMMPGSLDEPLEALLAKHPVVTAIRDCGPGAAPSVVIEGTMPEDARLWVAAVRLGPCGGATGGEVKARMILRSLPLTRKGRVYDSWQVFKLADPRASGLPGG